MSNLYHESMAFQRAIAENPDDVLHRLIYADWLEERGIHDVARVNRLFAQMIVAVHMADEFHKNTRPLYGSEHACVLYGKGGQTIRVGKKFPTAVSRVLHRYQIPNSEQSMGRVVRCGGVRVTSGQCVVFEDHRGDVWGSVPLPPQFVLAER